MIRCALASLITTLLFSGCTELKILYYAFPDVTDYNLRKQLEVKASETPFNFIRDTGHYKLPEASTWTVNLEGKKEPKQNITPEQYLISTNTTAFLIIQNDTVLYEKYFHGYKKRSKLQHFSISKAVAGLLCGIAIEEGYIKGVDQKIGDFIEYYKDDPRGDITIGHLLNMTSGFNNTDYKNKYKTVKLYYASNPDKIIKNIKQRYKPGEKFEYSSFATLILGKCIESATGKPYNEYLSEKLWSKIGTAKDASIASYTNGTPLYYGGLTSNPDDLAKIGKLLIQKGKWEGEEVVSENWIDLCKSKKECYGKRWLYSNGFWLDTFQCLTEEEIETRKWNEMKCNCSNENEMFAAGYKGQALYIDLSKKLIILRLGEDSNKKWWSLSLSKLASQIPIE